jgi:Leucine-rich repeat (LRR) protein
LLQELTLAGNRITELPSAISKLTDLQKLQVAGNLLTKLPDELGYLTNLEVRL